MLPISSTPLPLQRSLTALPNPLIPLGYVNATVSPVRCELSVPLNPNVSGTPLRYVVAEMKHHRPGGGVGVRVGLDDHGRQLSAIVVVTGQRFWVPGLRACSGAGKVERSQWAACGTWAWWRWPRRSGARRAGPNQGTEVTGRLCTPRPLRVPVRAFSEDT